MRIARLALYGVGTAAILLLELGSAGGDLPDADDAEWHDAGRSAWRQSCLITYAAGCARAPWLWGLVDDVPDAYNKFHVGANETRCLQRAREHFEWCRNGRHQRIAATFAPTGAEAGTAIVQSSARAVCGRDVTAAARCLMRTDRRRG